MLTARRLGEPNKKQLVIFMAMISCGAFACRLQPGSNLEPLLTAKYGWTEDNRGRYYSLSVIMILLGELLGAFIGGKILPKGRRTVFMYGLTLTVIGSIVRQIEFYPAYCLSTLICFLGGGFIQVAAPRYIEEVVPIKLYGFCVAFNMLA